MDMKQHIIQGLRDKYEDWDHLLGSLDEAQILAPLEPSGWSVKDIVTHLWAWQQRSIARVDAARLDQEPVFPRWAAGIDPEEEGSTDKINAWIYQTYHGRSWQGIYRNWSEGFRRFLELSGQISERNLLDSGRYPWLGGHALAFILIASYDHHQEHYEKLLARLRR